MMVSRQRAGGNKIDGAVALIMAVGRAMLYEKEDTLPDHIESYGDPLALTGGNYIMLILAPGGRALGGAFAGRDGARVDLSPAGFVKLPGRCACSGRLVARISRPQ